MMSVTRATACVTSAIVLPASLASTEPPCTFSTEVAISSLISFAAVDERCARLRTSLATTAKPRPCSPARAASTAAFSARMLVWNAMPSMMPMMSAIFAELSLMPCIVSTTRPTTALPFSATSDALAASVLACCALSAFCLTVEVSSSMLAAVSSSDAACCSVRWLRSVLPVAISFAAPPIAPLLSRTRLTVSVRRSFMSREGAQQVARFVLRVGDDPAAQVAARHRARDIDGKADRTDDRARDRQAGDDGEQHRDGGHREQHVALRLVLAPILAHDRFAPFAREAGIRIGRLDERREERPAFVVDLRDRFVTLAREREADDIRRDRPIERFHAIHLRDETARLVARVGRGRDHVLQLPEPGLHVVVRTQDLGFLHFDIGGRRDQHEIARGDRAAVDRRAHLVGHIGTRIDAVDVAREVVGGGAERPERHARDHQHQHGHDAEARDELVLDLDVLQTHFYSPRRMDVGALSAGRMTGCRCGNRKPRPGGPIWRSCS